MQAINNQRAEWRLMSVDPVFVSGNMSSNLGPAEIKEVREAIEKVEIKEEKQIVVVSCCSMQ